MVMRPIRLGPEMRYWEQGERYKILTMTALLVICCALTYYFHAILKMGTVFTHLFYVPIILAALWWRRTGLVVAIFLSALLIFSHIFVRAEVVPADDYLRAIMFILIASAVATLSEMLAKAQAKTAHLNAVLRAIRNVDQLIVKEDDRDRLIRSACEQLIETHGYHSAWIALVDDDRVFLTAAEAGLGERFAPVVEMMKRGEFTRWGERVLEQPGIVVIDDVAAECAGCPLAGAYSDRAGMIVRLKFGDRVYGVLSVSIPDEMAAAADEEPLFNEVADDIAFALYRMELEAEHKKAEGELGRYRDHLEEMVEERTAELEAANYELKQEIAERKKAEALIEHLNSVLGAIRNVNQLLVSEKDRDSLLQKSCDALVEARGYDAAWIGLLQDGKNFVTVKCSGFAEDSSRFCEYVMDGTHPPCIRNVLDPNDIFAILDKSKACEDCLFNSECTGKEVAVVRLEHAGRLFGLLVVSLVADVTADEEEAELLKEVASDIALGLHDMEMEDAHRAAAEKFRCLVENIPIGISVSNAEGIVVDVNPTALKIFGYDSKEEFLKVPASDYYYDQKDGAQFAKLSKKGSVKDFEARFKRKDGTVFWLSTTSVIPITEVRECQLINAFKDITERKQAEEKLLESEGRYQRMVANVPGMVYQFVLHPDGSTALPFVSESCRELFGMEPHEIMRDANVLLDIIHPDDRHGFYRSVADSAKSLSPWGWEGRGTMSGEERWFRCISRPERQANGDILWDGLITDITERKLAETRVNEEYRRAEFYIDLMSHDINNVSQVTSGHLELLLKMPDLPSKFRKHAETALDHVRKGAGIISNVKTLSTVRSGELEIEKIDIYPAFASAVETAKSQSRDVRINSNITEGRYFIRGNALLFDVFSNLLNNAVKFDGHDIVEIDVDISSSDDNWEIRFMDRGRGIRSDYKKIVFNRLERAGESAQGSGLGLTIVKYIVESYGGKVWVEDRVKGDLTQGSNFIVLLPKGD